MRRFTAQCYLRFAAIGAIVAGPALVPAPAHARVFVGVGIGVPFFGPAYIPPPYYYPPPVVYAPPPAYYAPPPQVYAPPPQNYAPSQGYDPATGPAGGPQSSQACYAGQYVCPMDRPIPSGANCYCPAGGGQRVPGRAS